MQLEDLLTDTWPADRVVVGRHQGRLVALERGQPLLVVGPPRAGKTTALMTPNVARWGGNVVATSIRADLLDTTYAQRAGCGEVVVFDPTGSLGYTCAGHYNFVALCKDYNVARRIANAITQYMRYDGVRDGEFWRSSAARLITVLLYAAAYDDASIDTVTHWLVSPDSDDVRNALATADNPNAVSAYADFCMHGSDSYVGSVRATALAAMQTYEDSRVAQSVKRGGLDAERFLDGDTNSLYLCVTPEDQTALAPYSALTVDAIVAAKHRRTRRVDPSRAPLLLALDEAMNIAPLRDLAVLASTAAGTGIQLITVAHDFSQIVRRYGESDAHTIVANHSLLLLGGGLREHALSVLLDRLVDPRQVPDGIDWTGTPSEWVRRLDTSHALLIHRDLPPVVVDLTRWFDDDRQVVDHLEAIFALEPFDDSRDSGAPAPTSPPHDAADPSDDCLGTDDWSRIECGPTGVSARFPSSPHYESERDGLLGTRHQLRHEREGLSVALDVTEITAAPFGPTRSGSEDVLERIASGIAFELDADVVALEPVSIGDRPALDIDLRGADHHTQVRLTTTCNLVVAARVRAREPAHDVFGEFARTLVIAPDPPGQQLMETLRVDRSGRITVPAAMRERLTESLVMSQWKGRIRVWSQSAFDAQVAEFQSVDDREPIERRIMRGVLASSAPTGIDDRGRLCIPERFRTSCGIGILVVLTLSDDGFELAPLT